MISPSTSNLCLAFHTMLFWMHATSHKSALRRRLGIVNEDIVMFGTYGVGHPWHTTHSQQYAHPCWFLIFPLVKCEVCRFYGGAGRNTIGESLFIICNPNSSLQTFYRETQGDHSKSKYMFGEMRCCFLKAYIFTEMTSHYDVGRR